MKVAQVLHSPEVSYYVDSWRVPKSAKECRIFLRQKMASLPRFGMMVLEQFENRPRASWFSDAFNKPAGSEIIARELPPKLYVIRLE